MLNELILSILNSAFLEEMQVVRLILSPQKLEKGIWPSAKDIRVDRLIVRLAKTDPTFS